MLKIRELIKSEINLLKNFPPEDWNINLPEFIAYHFNHNYFYPVIAVLDGNIAGFGQAILFEDTAWLGNILVPPEFRRQGIGYEITSHLFSHLNKKGFDTQILMASSMGKNIYKKIGFFETAVFNFYAGKNGSESFKKDDRIIQINDEDFSSIKKIDEEITGEKRYNFIKDFFHQDGCLKRIIKLPVFISRISGQD